jgi:hypothetical protein
VVGRPSAVRPARTSPEDEHIRATSPQSALSRSSDSVVGFCGAPPDRFWPARDESGESAHPWRRVHRRRTPSTPGNGVSALVVVSRVNSLHGEAMQAKIQGDVWLQLSFNLTGPS